MHDQQVNIYRDIFTVWSVSFPLTSPAPSERHIFFLLFTHFSFLALRCVRYLFFALLTQNIDKAMSKTNWYIFCWWLRKKYSLRQHHRAHIETSNASNKFGEMSAQWWKRNEVAHTRSSIRINKICFVLSTSCAIINELIFHIFYRWIINWMLSKMLTLAADDFVYFKFDSELRSVVVRPNF